MRALLQIPEVTGFAVGFICGCLSTSVVMFIAYSVGG